MNGLTANQTCWEDSEKNSLVIKQLYYHHFESMSLLLTMLPTFQDDLQFASLPASRFKKISGCFIGCFLCCSNLCFCSATFVPSFLFCFFCALNCLSSYLNMFFVVWVCAVCSVVEIVVVSLYETCFRVFFFPAFFCVLNCVLFFLFEHAIFLFSGVVFVL